MILLNPLSSQVTKGTRSHSRYFLFISCFQYLMSGFDSQSSRVHQSHVMSHLHFTKQEPFDAETSVCVTIYLLDTSHENHVVPASQ